jgi:hypothetical protein
MYKCIHMYIDIYNAYMMYKRIYILIDIYLYLYIIMHIHSYDSEMRQHLEDGHTTVPRQATSDLIPLLDDKEIKQTISELKAAKKFSLCTDRTRMMCDIDGFVSLCNLYFNLLFDFFVLLVLVFMILIFITVIS